MANRNPGNQGKRGLRKIRQGTVISDKMDKTVVVEVKRRIKDPMYKKYVLKRKRFKAHDEKNQCSTGDRVEIIETRPLSRQKRWRVLRIIEKAA
jgi:small subunit ribosomal protein S17